MTRTRKYGFVCLSCQRSLEVGEVDLDSDAGELELRRALAGSGWQARIVECPKCSLGRLYRVDDLILLD